MPDTKLSLKNDDITWTATSEGTVIVLDLRSSQYLTVNSSASGLWEMLAAGESADSLVTRLQSDYGLAHDTATADVDRFLADLRSRDLIHEQ